LGSGTFPNRFHEAVGEESDVGEAIRVKDLADFGRRRRLHRFIIGVCVFQTSVSCTEHVLVVGSGIMDLLPDTQWDGGGVVEEFSAREGTTDVVDITAVSEATEFQAQLIHLLPGLIGSGFPILVFWVLVILEVAFICFCVMLVPRATGKEGSRSTRGGIIAGTTKGRCVFRGCGLSRLWLWTRGHVKKTYEKRGSVVGASEEIKTFMIFLHWLQDNGWISARVEDWAICKLESCVKSKLNTSAFLRRCTGGGEGSSQAH
jgi:hypothetical protein